MRIDTGPINVFSHTGIACVFNRVEMQSSDSVQLYDDDTHKCGIYEPALTDFLKQCNELDIKVIDKRKQAEGL